jgi:hypothetical protein
MIFIPLDLWSDIFGYISNNIGTSLLLMAVPFIIGLVVGFFVKKLLKIAIIAAVILVILAYFGIFGLSFGTLGAWAVAGGGAALAGGMLLFGVLPLGIGFIIGLILGFIFG